MAKIYGLYAPCVTKKLPTFFFSGTVKTDFH